MAVVACVATCGLLISRTPQHLKCKRPPLKCRVLHVQAVRRRLADVAPHLGQLDTVQHPLWLNGEYFKVRLPLCALYCLCLSPRPPITPPRPALLSLQAIYIPAEYQVVTQLSPMCCGDCCGGGMTHRVYLLCRRLQRARGSRQRRTGRPSPRPSTTTTRRTPSAAPPPPWPSAPWPRPTPHTPRNEGGPEVRRAHGVPAARPSIAPARQWHTLTRSR